MAGEIRIEPELGTLANVGKDPEFLLKPKVLV